MPLAVGPASVMARSLCPTRNHLGGKFKSPAPSESCHCFGPPPPRFGRSLSLSDRDSGAGGPRAAARAQSRWSRTHRVSDCLTVAQAVHRRGPGPGPSEPQ